MGEKTKPKSAPSGRVKFSLLPQGLREKLIVAFSLMSIVPLLVLGYLLTNYVFPQVDTFWDVSILAGVTAFIAFLGLAVARAMVLPVIRLTAQAQEIASGSLEKTVEVEAPDEVGSLGVALNQITQRVRENMTQLRVYGEQTKHLNLEINRRILTLSHLLQVSNLITQSAKIEEVIAFIVDKLSQVDETELNVLLESQGSNGTFLVRAASGSDARRVVELQERRLNSSWLAQVLKGRQIALVDEAHPAEEGKVFLREAFGMTNAFCQPIVSLGQGIGLLLSLNRKEGFSFQEDCQDLIKVFGKQVAIAIENDLLTKRAEELKVVDELTGLYNAGFMERRLEEELRRALRFQRPCSLLVLRLDDFQEVSDLYGSLAAEGVLHQMGDLLRAQATEVDRVGRMGPDEFALILPEKNKREAMVLAETIRSAVGQNAFTNGKQPIPRPFSISAGISAAPLDGSNAADLYARAQGRVKSARGQGKNRIIAV